MAKKAHNEFQMNRPVFLTMVTLSIAIIGLVGYDLAIGKSPFDGHGTYVLSETDSVEPTVTPYITPTNTP
jgi:hypothetical protein